MNSSCIHAYGANLGESIGFIKMELCHTGQDINLKQLDTHHESFEKK